MEEEWKQSSYCYLYEVSNKGQVKNKITGNIKKQYKDKRGYMRTGLTIDKKTVVVRVHNMVIDAFLGVRTNKHTLYINHIDGDKSNNNLENLELVTPKENSQHASRTGLIPSGEDCYQAQYTNDQIRNLHYLYRSGRSIESLAVEYDTKKSNIDRILKGDRWKKIFQEFNKIT